jgi:tetratricopeptide (TPR) repeat protein
LFIERAQAVRSDFTVTVDNAPALAEICVRLDGLPLAIELAAARSKLFPPKALLARLDKRLTLLTGGPRDLPARQQTLRNAIAWSYDLLDAAEQAIFARLGVFVGGCSLTAAEEVLGGDSIDEEQLSVSLSSDALLEGLVSLVNKSLLKQVDGPNGEPRFMMLETIREYARARLEELGDINVLQQRHAQYYFTLIQTTEPKQHRAVQGHALERLDIDHENLRAALHWSKTQEQPERWLELAAAAWWFWYFRGYWSEGYSWLKEAVSHPLAIHYPTAHAKALYALSAIAWVGTGETGDYATALAFAQESVAHYRRLDDRHGLGCALFFVGLIAVSHNAMATAHLACDEALALFREVGDAWWLALTLNCRGIVELYQRHFEAARSWLEESLALWQKLDDPWGLSLPLGHLGTIAYEQDDFEAACEYYERSLALRRAIGDKSNLYNALNRLGYVVLRQGNHERAKALFRESLIVNDTIGRTVGSAESLIGLAGLVAAPQAVRWLGAATQTLSAIGAQHVIITDTEYEQNLEHARAQLDEATFAAAWAEGRTLALEQAISEAIAVTGAN